MGLFSPGHRGSVGLVISGAEDDRGKVVEALNEVILGRCVHKVVRTLHFL